MSYCRMRMSIFSLLIVFLSMILIINLRWLPLWWLRPLTLIIGNLPMYAMMQRSASPPPSRGDAPNNLGSLEFTTNTITNGQDKADYVKYRGVVAGRTLGNLSA